MMNNIQENKNQKKEKSHVIFDITGRVYSYISMALIVCVFAFILVVTFRYGWGALSPSFLITEPNPSAINTEAGGILTPIIGTFILTIIGIVIAFPFALATAVYLCFYTKKGFFKTLVKSAVDILAGVPTIVIALFALVVFTLPQMGFLSSLVDTRRNTLSGTELTFIYSENFNETEIVDEIYEPVEFEELTGGYWNEYGEWIEVDEFDDIVRNGVLDVPQPEIIAETADFEEWEKIRVVFDDNLDIKMTAKQYAETIFNTFNHALAGKNIPKDKISVEAVDGKVIIKVGSSAEPLIFYSSTNTTVEETLGIVQDEIINPGETREYIVDAFKITGGTVRSYGRSFLVCGITMAVMILPFVIKSMEEALKSVPASYIDGALALGATKWRTIYKIVLRTARDGLITGVILGMGRIIGDTAIVWLTLGGSIRMTGAQPWYAIENLMSTLRNSGSTLTTYIYYTSPAGEGNQFDVAFGAALVLIGIIILLNIIATVIGKAGVKKNG
ncbi:MAG: ABC transporter permease subunit [Oscillospiraceae bacterium]|nr:ABC transporter permease subunit [Oscillospiraceae bacterium]